ncbi:MAG: hypothetical protein ABIT04_11455 [Novosphingobium sp.]
MRFDPDALLAALPKREIKPLPAGIRVSPSKLREVRSGSVLGDEGEYNGFTSKERSRTAAVSNWLAAVGATERPPVCDICGRPGKHEHAENYYDLCSWVGICVRCHTNLLHKRLANDGRWQSWLGTCELPCDHWSRLVSPQPFDLAGLLRARGAHEPLRQDFA